MTRKRGFVFILVSTSTQMEEKPGKRTLIGSSQGWASLAGLLALAWWKPSQGDGSRDKSRPCLLYT